MRHIPQRLISSAACVLALSLSSGAFAQQASPTSAASSSMPTSGAAADNTGTNRRDDASHTMTPFDQPNDKTDIKLAARVRRAIVKDKALSSSAHNLKLIAASGVVTLRGPVASADEKARVESLVSAVAGVSRVDNQLDVKNP
jgi:hyperosmotically inducible protein